MNKLSEISTKELLEKAWKELGALCGSSGPRKEWRMTVPVDEDRDSDVLFGEVLKRLAQLEAVMEATDPWVATMAIPNGYNCHYCRAFLRGFPNRDMKEEHKEDCIFLEALEAG